MVKRNKTPFEKWFSLSRHQRRSGANKLSALISTNFKVQKAHIISGEEITYTHGSSNDLSRHFHALEQEFVGQSELCFTHAKIIVLIRREFEVEKNFKQFDQLWHSEKKYLLKHLNTRWLIAAADTLADCSNDNTVIALSVACTCLLNTVKIQESERFITNAHNCSDDLDKIQHLDNERRFSLFDGTSVFKFGTDDTLRNMRWRIDKVAKFNVAGEILLEVFKRLQKFDTVYKRTKDRHTRGKTGWW